MKSLFKVSPASDQVDLGLLVARVGIALFMFTHGIPKIGRMLADPVRFMDFMGLGPEISLGLAIFAEVICAALVLIGLGTRLAVIPQIITMLVAAFIAHGDDPFSTKEKPLMYVLAFVVLLITGSGKYSVDQIISSEKSSDRKFN